MGKGETLEHAVRKPPFGAPYVFALAVIDGEQPQAIYRAGCAESLVGRGQPAHIDVDDDEVSKRHCVVRVDGPVCTVTDLGSRNGTFVNGRRLREGVAQRLRHLDELRVGTTRMFLLAGRFRARPK